MLTEWTTEWSILPRDFFVKTFIWRVRRDDRSEAGSREERRRSAGQSVRREERGECRYCLLGHWTSSLSRTISHQHPSSPCLGSSLHWCRCGERCWAGWSSSEGSCEARLPPGGERVMWGVRRIIQIFSFSILYTLIPASHSRSSRRESGTSLSSLWSRTTKVKPEKPNSWDYKPYDIGQSSNSPKVTNKEERFILASHEKISAGEQCCI